MGAQERGAEEEVGERKRFFSFFFFLWLKEKKKGIFCRSICLLVLNATVVRECLMEGSRSLRGYVLYCFGLGSESSVY